MKHKYNFLSALVLSALTLTSCDLDTSSKTELNTETAYSNAEACDMALVGCYDGWQRTVSDEGIGMYLTSEFASEQAFAGLGSSDARNFSVIDEFNTGLAPSFNDLYNTDWKNYYKAIFRCNQLIKQANSVTNWDGDEKAKNRILGEARTLRAILYFDLTRLFGDVPLTTEPTEETLPRSAAKDVYQVIFDDLKFAAGNIPADAYPADSRNSNDGRITCYAADALLARAYLYYTGYYGEEHPACSKTEAVSALEKVVSSGNYALEKRYKDLWMASSDVLSETNGDTYAWELSYAGKWYDGSAWRSGQGNLSSEIVLNLKFNTTSDYNGNSDGNTFAVYLGPSNRCATNVHIASGWAACPVTPYFVKQYRDDPRFSACVWGCQESGFEPDTTNTYEYTGYYTRKYAPMCMADGTRQEVAFQLGEKYMTLTNYQDYTVMRYADVLLMLAELTGNKEYLNQVRRRAGLPDEEYTVENLRRERAIEFAFEGIHYWDIMRYEKDGAYAARVLAEAQNGADVLNGGTAAKTTFTQSNFTQKKGLMQVPNTQISISGGAMTQNTGW